MCRPLKPIDGKVRLWRRKGEKYNQSNFETTVAGVFDTTWWRINNGMGKGMIRRSYELYDC